MRIGIATFQWADNYGALLQAYALQSYLQALGHKAEIIDYRPFNRRGSIFNWIAKTPMSCLRKWESNYKSLIFKKFREKYFSRSSKPILHTNELNKLANNFDLLITGSDQVWNPRWLDQADGLYDFCFLSFGEKKTKRISYAASIGHSSLDTLSKEWQNIMRHRLLEMDSISVREKSGVPLIKELCGREDAVCVVDPTLLLNKKTYLDNFRIEEKKQKQLFSFMLHGLERDAEKFNNFLSSKQSLKIAKCNARNTALHKGYSLPKVEGWLNYVCNSEFVVTNSFHCVVFCLLFHTPFVVLLISGKIGSMNSRITDLLSDVGLENRMVYSSIEPQSLNLAEIDWDKVDRAIDSLKKESKKYLKECIG